MQTSDQLPRIFQANLARLFERVIQPAMEALPVHASLECGEAATMEQFLDRAAAQVDNYTANEAAKAFTLTIAAIFERQLSIWVRTVHIDNAIGIPKSRGFQDFLALCAERAGIDISAEAPRARRHKLTVSPGNGPRMGGSAQVQRGMAEIQK
ncbi:hypothetical protein ABIB99_008906 [Bradyrhizobium sp. LA6.1]|uniref:hypothetical protein n=1 Tax=Bradyrhizobium sp. LA6.1 TaxID=3156378 RepID=UPI003393A342